MADISLGYSSWTIVSLFVGFLALLPTIMGLFSKNKFNVNGKTVLLLGASEGMGKSVANQLARKGANIIIVSRSVTKLEAALAEAKASAANPSAQRLTYISADLTDPTSASRVLTEATTWNNGKTPDIVWCIAGSSYPAFFIETPVSLMRQQMDINFWSCVDMAHAVLNAWLSPTSSSKGTERHLIFTSSVVAFIPIVGYGPYSPGKAAIKSLSDTLAQEVLLYGEDVKIHTVFPGNILTPGFENENKTKPGITHKLEEADPSQMPDMAAAKAIKGLESGEYLVTLTWLGALMRGLAWGGSAKNNWLVDSIVSWVAGIIWAFVGMDLDGKVKAYGKEHGHPSTYAKKT